jgi:hypothetical protein
MKLIGCIFCHTPIEIADETQQKIRCPNCKLLTPVERDVALGLELLSESDNECAEPAQPAELTTEYETKDWRQLVRGEKQPSASLAGCFFICVGGVIVLVTIMLYTGLESDPEAVLPSTIGAGLLGVLGCASIYLITYGRRLRADLALDALARFNRPPILLLRTFTDDYLSIGVTLNWSGMGSRSLTFEEVLYGVFAPWGPVIAIGRPYETLPPLGAARMWVDNADWQRVVDRIIDQCSYIVMVMGDLAKHAGLQWEINRVIARGVLDKLILVMPPVRESDARKRWNQYAAVLAKQLPAYRGGEVMATQGKGPEWQVARVRTDMEGDCVRDKAVYREGVVWR